MSEFTIKRNDTATAIKATLQSNFASVNLTDSTVRFLMSKSSDEMFPTIDNEAMIHDATQGIVWYQFSADDTEKEGRFQAEFEVTFPDGGIETFPNNGYININIIKDLG